MDLIVSPATVALNPQQGAAVPVLKAGDIIEAKVLELLSAGIAKLAIGNSVVDVQTKVALTPGSTVRLAVRNTPEGLRLTLLGTASIPAGPPQPPAIDAPASVTDAMVSTALPRAAAASATPAAPAAGDPPALAAGSTTADPAGDTPATAVSVTGAGSGGASSGAVAVASGEPPQPSAQPTPNSAAAAAAALSVAVQTSAARQGGLAPLLADAGIATTVTVLPEPVRQAAERLLALQPALDETVSADTLRQALGRSGLLLEAHLSASAANGDAPPNARAATLPPADDIKAALIVLRSVLKTWLAAEPQSPAVPDHVALRTAAAMMALRATAAGVPDGAAPTPTQSNGGTIQPAMRPPGSVAPPPPPYRGAPTVAQSASAPSISADMPVRDIGRVLLNETDAAIARQTLLQAASLPDHMAPNAGGARVDVSGPRWLFEVPFTTPQGSTVAQFEIAQDGQRAPSAASAPAWRARFSLDVEPIGPVHAQIALIGSRAAVTLWAERPETSVQLRDNAAALADALRQVELDPGDVLVRAGAPPRPRENAPSGRFLDRAS